MSRNYWEKKHWIQIRMANLKEEVVIILHYQQTGRELLTPDEIRLLDNRKAILFIRGERPIMDDKYDLKKHVNFRYTEDGGASPYDYAKTPLAHDDLKIDINRLDDYELLSTEDILGE